METAKMPQQLLRPGLDACPRCAQPFTAEADRPLGQVCPQCRGREDSPATRLTETTEAVVCRACGEPQTRRIGSAYMADGVCSLCKRAAAERTLKEPPAEPSYEVIDGYVVDGNTGEVLGLAASDTPLSFAVRDRASADWVLAKLADCQAQVLAINARERMLLANLDRQRKAQLARLDWLHRRFDAELEAFARAELEGKRTKTLTLDHGRIAFRTARGRNVITDMARAVAWMRAEGYAGKVKVQEKVDVMDVLTAITTRTFDEGVEPDTSAFLVLGEGAGEKLAITTIEKE